MTSSTLPPCPAATEEKFGILFPPRFNEDGRASHLLSLPPNTLLLLLQKLSLTREDSVIWHSSRKSLPNPPTPAIKDPCHDFLLETLIIKESTLFHFLQIWIIQEQPRARLNILLIPV